MRAVTIRLDVGSRGSVRGTPSFRRARSWRLIADGRMADERPGWRSESARVFTQFDEVRRVCERFAAEAP